MSDTEKTQPGPDAPRGMDRALWIFLAASCVFTGTIGMTIWITKEPLLGLIILASLFVMLGCLPSVFRIRKAIDQGAFWGGLGLMLGAALTFSQTVRIDRTQARMAEWFIGIAKDYEFAAGFSALLMVTGVVILVRSFIPAEPGQDK